MTFRISVTGMNAASSDLEVTSHNIANVNTTGFKASRAEFADMFAVSGYGISQNATGAGARLAAVAQQFSQGNIDFTGRSLDIAISGQGFFTMADAGNIVYSRAGNFQADQNGYVVNPSGHRLQVFPPNASGGFDIGRLTDLQLPNGDSPPSATSSVTVQTTLPGGATQPVTAPFDPNDATSYNNMTSITVYDSLGGIHTQSVYYVKTATANEWEVYTEIDGTAVGGATTLTYDGSGTLVAPNPAQIALPAYTPTNGSAPMNITLNMIGSRQYGDKFVVNTLQQNGYATGRIIGVEISNEGVVSARYTNGTVNPLGQIAMTNFPNTQGLQPIGNNAWAETYKSGQPLRGQAGTSDFGMIQGGALEVSNVDLTEQLVNMISAQRNFQANSQMISTQDQIMQTVINIR